MDQEARRKSAENMKVNEDFRKSYEEKMKEQIQECNERIEELKHKADTFEERIREELRIYLRDFKSKLREAQMSLKSLKEAHRGDWEKKQHESDTVWRSLQAMMEQGFSSFK